MNNYDLKALTATLNSRLFYFWLLRNGKLKGSSLELYSRPLSEIPIKMFDKNSFSYLSNCVQNILDDPTEKKILENDIKINNKINELYQLSEKEISYINALYPINSLF